MVKKKLQEEIEEVKQDYIKALTSKGYIIKKANAIKSEPDIRTDIFSLDYLLNGGIKRIEGGTKIEFYGKESSLKTTFLLKIIAKYQSLGLKCLFIDAEESFSDTWASTLGVDTNSLAIGKPSCLEDAANMMIDAVKEGVDLIGVDSIASLVPSREADESIANMTMGLQARLFSQMCRSLNRVLAEKMTTMIFINQIREKIGVMYGNPETTPGGHGLLHFYNTRIKFQSGEPIEAGTGSDKERIGFVSKMLAIKNKQGKPWRSSSVDFYYDGRVDNKKSLLYAAMKFSIITRAGSWFEYKDIRKQGADSLCEAISDEQWKEIEEEIWKKLM